MMSKKIIILLIPVILIVGGIYLFALKKEEKIVEDIEETETDVIIKELRSDVERIIFSLEKEYKRNYRYEKLSEPIIYVVEKGQLLDESIIITGKEPLPYSGKFVLNKKGQVALAVSYDEVCVVKGFVEADIIISQLEGECTHHDVN